MGGLDNTSAEKFWVNKYVGRHEAKAIASRKTSGDAPEKRFVFTIRLIRNEVDRRKLGFTQLAFL